MSEEAKCAQVEESKQNRTGNALKTLRASIERLESLVDRVEDNNMPRPESVTGIDKVPGEDSLSAFLNKLPEKIVNQADRIDSAIERLRTLLY